MRFTRRHQKPWKQIRNLNGTVDLYQWDGREYYLYDQGITKDKADKIIQKTPPQI